MNDWNGNNAGQDELQAMLEGDFNAKELAAQHRPLGGYVDPGTYGLRIAKAEIKNTKAGTGKYVSVEFEVGAPSEYDGAARIRNNYNLVNPSEKAVRIAKIEFAALCIACGFGETEKPPLNALIGKTLVADVGFELGDPRPDGGFYSDSNTITKYHPKGTQGPTGPDENKVGFVARMQAMRGPQGPAPASQSFNDDDIPF